MGLIHMFLNLVLPPFTFFTLLLLVPPYQAFKCFISFWAFFFHENVAGKVVLITGASSGIGEDINFWGSVYTTRFAVPHLRNTGGKIIAISSIGLSSPLPRMSIYNASKAAMLAFFETLRVELGSDIHITIVTPGFIESEMTQGKCQARDGKLTLDQNIADEQVGIFPVARVDSCAREILNRACRGERYVTEPKWFTFAYWFKVFVPEATEWTTRMLYMTSPGEPASYEAPTKKILDMTGPCAQNPRSRDNPGS